MCQSLCFNMSEHCLLKCIFSEIHRYIAICHPFLLHQDRIQRPSCHASHTTNANNTNSLKKRTLAYMLPVFVVSIIINIPKFMEFRTESE